MDVDVDVDDSSVVSGVSNPGEYDVDEDKENEVSASPSDLLSPLVPTKISLPKQKPKKSWVWHHFKPILSSKEYA